MEFSWSQTGMLIGATVGYVNYMLAIGILEPRLRALDKSQTVEERAAFERKLVLMRRIIFVFEIAAFAGVGYFLGSLLR